MIREVYGEDLSADAELYDNAIKSCQSNFRTWKNRECNNATTIARNFLKEHLDIEEMTWDERDQFLEDKYSELSQYLLYHLLCLLE